ncbi:MAG: hypothetical protein COB09_18710 [Thalassobium sp.]|nr:MAG: hypothetical protein COB09_18710 [Thalassobium sp.]
MSIISKELRKKKQKSLVRRCRRLKSRVLILEDVVKNQKITIARLEEEALQIEYDSIDDFNARTVF